MYDKCLAVTSMLKEPKNQFFHRISQTIQVFFNTLITCQLHTLTFSCRKATQSCVKLHLARYVEVRSLEECQDARL